MTELGFIRQVFRTTVSMVCGLDPARPPLGGVRIRAHNGHPIQDQIAAVFQGLAGGRCGRGSGVPCPSIRTGAAVAEKVFVGFYSEPERSQRLTTLWSRLRSASSDEARAKWTSIIWAPELQQGEDEILAKWKLADVQSNPHPIRPAEVVIQLNALYTLPEEPAETLAGLPAEIRGGWEKIKADPGPKIAEYDHPVSLFETGRAHELMACLDELNGDIAFEKDCGVLTAAHRLLVLISVSVTHAHLDALCGKWVEFLLKSKRYRHLACLVITEERIGQIQGALFEREIPVYSVLGKYAAHFNALKYSQLLLERAYGVRAGFKLDTDEGIRSRDLYRATGQTWFQTMCHPLWGGTARDFEGRAVSLDINEGEYVNWSDIQSLGYSKALRTPDVCCPTSYLGSEIFFNKAFAHGRSTELYNRFHRLEDHLSHPVVKGGGYGITNAGLRRAAPFAYSKVGRAEDQQFYFSALARGCRGIFHPDLRIAHYKGLGGAVAKAEQKTVATRFAGDMYRLVVFRSIVGDLGIKAALDPMPGVFAGELARAQAWLSLFYKAYSFFENGKPRLGELLIQDGAPELDKLCEEIDAGEVQSGMRRECAAWRQFIKTVDALDGEKVKRRLDSYVLS